MSLFLFILIKINKKKKKPASTTYKLSPLSYYLITHSFGLLILKLNLNINFSFFFCLTYIFSPPFNQSQ